MSSLQKSLKNKSEYQIYEDQLNEYKNRNKSKVMSKPQQWDLIQSQILDKNHNNNNKRYDRDSKDVLGVENQNRKDVQESRAISHTSSKSINAEQPSMSTYPSILTKIQSIPVPQKSTQTLQSQIKQLRLLLQCLNAGINKKLSKYELHTFSPKGMAITNEPQKQSQLLLQQIQTNSKVLQALQKQIKQIKDRDRELEENDYLIDLEISVGDIMRNIREAKKKKYNGKVVVERLDGRLLELEESAIQSQFRAVKHLKHNILHYYRKEVQQSIYLQQLSKQQKQITQKTSSLQQKYQKYLKLAQQKNLPVKVNQSYLQKKRIQQQLCKKLQTNKKAVQVMKKGKDSECVKIGIQCEHIRKQILEIQNKVNRYNQWDKQVENNIEEDISKNKRGVVLAKMLNKLGESSPSVNQQSAGGSPTRDILQSLPSVPLAKRLQLQRPQYHTIQIQRSLRQRKHRKLQSSYQQNDKNLKSIRFEDEQINTGKSGYRIKPSIHVKKRIQANSLDSRNLNNKTTTDNTISSNKNGSKDMGKSTEDIVEDILASENSKK